MTIAVRAVPPEQDSEEVDNPSPEKIMLEPKAGAG
jgi:hypothetical protein